MTFTLALGSFYISIPHYGHYVKLSHICQVKFICHMYVTAYLCISHPWRVQVSHDVAPIEQGELKALLMGPMVAV